MKKLPPKIGVVCGTHILYGQDSGRRFGPRLVCIEPPPQGRLLVDEDQQARLLRRNRLSLPTSLFRRNCYPDIEWFDERLRANVDWDFAIRLAAHTKIYEDLHPYLLVYQTADDHISHNERQTLLSLARVMKKNREAFRCHPKAHGFQLYRLGTGLFHLGKRRLGRRFIVAGLVRNPARFWLTVRRRLFGYEIE